jgi:hypothetical protein
MDGRVTLMLSCSGQMPSDISVSVEHIPTDIYFTPREEATSERTLEDALGLIVQLFIREIGLPFTKARTLRPGAAQVDTEQLYCASTQVLTSGERPDWPTLPFEESPTTFVSTAGWKDQDIPVRAGDALARAFPHLIPTVEAGPPSSSPSLLIYLMRYPSPLP